MEKRAPEETFPQAGPSKKRCKIKSAGRNVRAPMINPELPSLGAYEKMIKTPEKSPIQEKCQYTLSVPEEQPVDNEPEEGEILEDEENKTNEDNQKEQETNETNQDDYEEEETDIRTTIDEEDHNEDIDNDCEDYDKPLEEIVKIPQEMFEPEEQSIVREYTKQKDIENADKQIDNLEQLIKEHLRGAAEEEVTGTESVFEQEATVRHNVITVQPIAYNDEIFDAQIFQIPKARKQAEKKKKNLPVQKQQEETVTEIKDKLDDDLILIKCDFADVHKEVKAE